MSNDEARARELLAAADDVERVAYALYLNEMKRSTHARDILRMASGKPCDGIMIEPWDECGGAFREDARVALAALQSASPGAADAGGEVERVRQCWDAIKREFEGAFRVIPEGGRYREVMDMDAAIAALASIAPASEDGWLPIEEAPSDREFLGGYWWRDKWLSNACKLRERPSGQKVIESRTGWRYPATHYQELPAPPARTGKGDAK